MTERDSSNRSPDFVTTSNFEELSKRSNISPDELKKKFYERGERFWRSSAPTLSTMLGGLEFISAADADDSRKFIRKLKREKLLAVEKPSVACDCACGIGRVTRDVLLNFFDTVDLVEMAPEFLAKAPEFICSARQNSLEDDAVTSPEEITDGAMKNVSALTTAETASSPIMESQLSSELQDGAAVVANNVGTTNGRIGRLICSPLQHADLEGGRYDIIWLQWAAGQLEDNDLVAFFRRSVAALKPGGCVIVKDNVVESQSVEYDEQDGSYMRPLTLWKTLLAEAHVHLMRCERVRIYPKSWHPVYYFVFRAHQK